MAVASYVQPDATTQDPAAYKAAIDSASSVHHRLAGAFAPHAQSTPDMTVRLDAGHLFNGTTLTEVAAQSTAVITAPVGNPRIDRVVVNRSTGAVSVVTGMPGASPSAPAITTGCCPVAQVLLQTTSAAITNAMITDERDLTALGLASGAFSQVGTAAALDSGNNAANLPTVAAMHAMACALSV